VTLVLVEAVEDEIPCDLDLGTRAYKSNDSRHGQRIDFVLVREIDGRTRANLHFLNDVTLLADNEPHKVRSDCDRLFVPACASFEAPWRESVRVVS
jgi:hypothetical protein